MLCSMSLLVCVCVCVNVCVCVCVCAIFVTQKLTAFYALNELQERTIIIVVCSRLLLLSLV